jgi:hypothetical protein
MHLRRSIATALLVVIDAAALAGLAPQAAAGLRVAGHPRAELARLGTDAALGTAAAAGLWCAAAWLALGLTAAAAARRPGRGGRWAAALARALLPRALRTLVAGGAGVGLLLAPAAALAAPPPPAAPTAPAWPVQNPSQPPPPPSGTAPAHRSPHPDEAVVVRPGDSLWSIAAHRLGDHPPDAHVAAAWPRWFSANRSVIGDDPALIRPGAVLHPPASDPHSEEARP